MILKKIVRFLLTVFIAAVAGVVSFYVTHSLEIEKSYTRQSAMRNWLEFTGEQDDLVQQTDPGFDAEAAELSSLFIAERQHLAQLFEAPLSSDEQIMPQVEKVIGANHALLKRVVSYILAVRKHLLPQQQQQLMNLCSNIIRGRAAKSLLSVENKEGAEKHFGGPEKGRGRAGQGRGWGRRHRRGLASDIEFTPEQATTLQQLDPGFKTESAELTEAVSLEHKQLALLLDTLDTNDHDIWQQLTKLLDARAQLERRTALHVLLIRPHLSPEQQKILVGLCAQCDRTFGN